MRFWILLWALCTALACWADTTVVVNGKPATVSVVDINGKTFVELNNGFEPTDWTREGAMLAGNVDGSVLYACRNGELYRGAPPLGTLRLSSARVQPAAGAG